MKFHPAALMLLAVPVSAWGAWRLLKVVGHLVDPLGLPLSIKARS